MLLLVLVAFDKKCPLFIFQTSSWRGQIPESRIQERLLLFAASLAEEVTSDCSCSERHFTATLSLFM